MKEALFDFDFLVFFLGHFLFFWVSVYIYWASKTHGPWFLDPKLFQNKKLIKHRNDNS